MKKLINIKRIIVAIIVFVLLAMDWAAINDILKNEPEPIEEYAFLIMLAGIFIILLGSWIDQLVRLRKKK